MVGLYIELTIINFNTPYIYILCRVNQAKCKDTIRFLEYNKKFLALESSSKIENVSVFCGKFVWRYFGTRLGRLLLVGRAFRCQH